MLDNNLKVGHVGYLSPNMTCSLYANIRFPDKNEELKINKAQGQNVTHLFIHLQKELNMVEKEATNLLCNNQE